MFLFDTYANDLQCLDNAITALKAGDQVGCAEAIGGVTTMAWGQEVGNEAYASVLDYIAYNDHLLWAHGFMPRLTDVRREYMSLTGRSADGGMTDAQILQSLMKKRCRVFESVTTASQQAGHGFRAAARQLRQL